MAASPDRVGVNHLTVVPTNFETDTESVTPREPDAESVTPQESAADADAE